MKTSKKRRNPTAAELREPIAIPDTPENIGRALMRNPPKKRWRYLEKPAPKRETPSAG